MIKEAIFLGSLWFAPHLLPFTLPLPVAATATAFVAVPIDKAINTATGGTAGKTISGDQGRARTAGSKYAKFMCETYTLVAPFDYVYFTQEERAYMQAKGKDDHCGRWETYESGDLANVKSLQYLDDWANLNR